MKFRNEVHVFHLQKAPLFCMLAAREADFNKCSCSLASVHTPVTSSQSTSPSFPPLQQLLTPHTHIFICAQLPLSGTTPQGLISCHAMHLQLPDQELPADLRSEQGSLMM